MRSCRFAAVDASGLPDNCAVCQHSMNRAKRLPCGHMFHADCLQAWLVVRPICPCCRAEVESKPASRCAAESDTHSSTSATASVDQLAGIAAAESSPVVQRLHEMFPRIPMEALIEDLRRTRSADVTVENIVNGRLVQFNWD